MRNVLFLFYAILPLACAGARPDSESGESNLVEGAQSINRRDDGLFDVQCVDGHAERGITADEIRANTVCEPAIAVSVGIGDGRGFAAPSHACALKHGGAVRCWGANTSGQLGNGTQSDSSVPVSVTGLGRDVTAIAAGGTHTCALLSVGTVKCWGNNTFAQLGNGTTDDSALPVEVPGLIGVTAIAASKMSTCALTAGGHVACWGAVGNAPVATTPTELPGLEGVTAIAAGGFFACAITATGGVKCWGQNNSGELGDGKGALNGSGNSDAAVDVTGLDSGVSAIALGMIHACALTAGGGVKCWGDDGNGVLGVPMFDPTKPPSSPVPVDAAGIASGATALASGGGYVCAKTSSELTCWGCLASTDSDTPSPLTCAQAKPMAIPGLERVTSVSVGSQSACALASGRVKCWGFNADGRLGNGTTASGDDLVDVSGL